MVETRLSLIRRVRDPSDHESWDEFTRLYKPLLYSYVRKGGLNEHDADDVVQEILIALLRRLPEFELDHSIGRFRTYLWQATHHAVVSWLRKRKRVAGAERQLDEQLAAAQQAAASEPDDEWVAQQRKRVFAFAMECVRERVQATTWSCFQEHLLKGRPAAEVGRELGLTSNAVYVNASRVLSRVRDKCAEYQEELADA